MCAGFGNLEAKIAETTAQLCLISIVVIGFIAVQAVVDCAFGRLRLGFVIGFADIVRRRQIVSWIADHACITCQAEYAVV